MSSSSIPLAPYAYSLYDLLRIGRSVFSRSLTHYSGNHIRLLEEEFASYEKATYAVATNSGTSALLLAVRAVGIKPGDEVIVPGYTFIAVAQAVLCSGGIPIFADIDDTFTISPISIEKQITKRTKAIIAVHMFGNVADISGIRRIIKDMHIALIEDCAQAIGATIDGKKVGILGDFGCFSFNEKKAIGTGQGGMVVTSSKDGYIYMKTCRDAGIDERDFQVKTVGYTLAMTEMEAILARSLLKKLPEYNQKRTKRAHQLYSELSDVRDVLTPFRVIPGAKPSYSRMAFQLKKRFAHQRDAFTKKMQEANIPLKTFYPTPLYQYPLFQSGKELFFDTPLFTHAYLKKYRSLRLPYAEQFCRSQVAMEWSPFLSHHHVLEISSCIRTYL